MTDLPPWEVNPDLTLDRLQLIAENLRDVRHDALEIHDEEKGDDAQVHGTLAYKRSTFRIVQLAMSGKCPWLSIQDGSRRFIFVIGGTPMRIYRGDSRRPPERSLRSYVAEILHSQLGLPFEEHIVPADGWVWRMAVETDSLGAVVRIVVFQTNQRREVRNAFEVPLRESVAEISPVLPLERAGTELPPARVGKKKPANTEPAETARAGGQGADVIPIKPKE